ncbi:MAG: DnaA N-terminal domain-containing protein, partial [Candidatus Kapaibacteriota bacterium]
MTEELLPVSDFEIDSQQLTLNNKDNLTAKWKKFLRFVKNNVSTHIFRTWFIPLKPLKIENNELFVQVP